MVLTRSTASGTVKMGVFEKKISPRSYSLASHARHCEGRTKNARKKVYFCCYLERIVEGTVSLTIVLYVYNLWITSSVLLRAWRSI